MMTLYGAPGWRAFGPGFFVCFFCGKAAANDFNCLCVPDFVKYCWTCRSTECGHQEVLVRTWIQNRSKKTK